MAELVPAGRAGLLGQAGLRGRGEASAFAWGVGGQELCGQLGSARREALAPLGSPRFLPASVNTRSKPGAQSWRKGSCPPCQPQNVHSLGWIS